MNTNITTLLAVERIVDIDALAARADELCVLYTPTAVNLAQPAAPVAGRTAAMAAATALQINNISNLMEAVSCMATQVSQLVANTMAMHALPQQ